MTAPSETLKEHLSPSFLRHIPQSEAIAQKVVTEFIAVHSGGRVFDSDELARLIWLALATALDHLDDGLEFSKRCRELGRSFAAHGLRARHFPVLAQLLLRHLDLEDAEADAWQSFILHIERAMVSESNRTAPAPAP